MWALRVRGPLLTLAAAALMFGGAGYAIQGSPGLAGSPAKGSAASHHVDVAGARHIMMGQSTRSEHWMILGDSFASRGKTDNAVALVQSGLRAHPDDYSLWVGLGNALVDHAHGLTPPAEFAYRRAAELSPGYPAPPFFYGLALARSGDPQGAVAVWRNILATAPKDASWRLLIEQGVAALSRPADRR